MKSNKIKKQISKEVRRLDPSLKHNSTEFQAASVLLASLFVGPKDRPISELLGYPLELVKTFGGRLRENKVWGREKIYADWGDPETGGAAFWMDAAVAMGYLARH